MFNIVECTGDILLVITYILVATVTPLISFWFGEVNTTKR